MAPMSPPASATAEASMMAGDVTIAVMQSSVGAYLAGADGKSLYVLTTDGASSSTCTDSCAQNWPAFTLTDGQTAIAGDGVTGNVSTFARADGSMQVAIDGHPVYYFAGDSAAGQTNGQGIGGVWFLAGPDGSPQGATSISPASGAGPSGNTTGSGYHPRPY